MWHNNSKTQLKKDLRGIFALDRDKRKRKRLQLDHWQPIVHTACACACRTVGPGFVDGGLLMELLGQMLQSFQTADLAEDPLLVALLRSLQSVPRSVDILRADSTRYWHQSTAGRRLLRPSSSVCRCNKHTLCPLEQMINNENNLRGERSRHTYRHHASLWRHEGRSVAESQFGLQSVEADLQLALLLDLQAGGSHALVDTFMQVGTKTLRSVT